MTSEQTERMSDAEIESLDDYSSKLIEHTKGWCFADKLSVSNHLHDTNRAITQLRADLASANEKLRVAASSLREAGYDLEFIGRECHTEWIIKRASGAVGSITAVLAKIAEEPPHA